MEFERILKAAGTRQNNEKPKGHARACMRACMRECVQAGRAGQGGVGLTGQAGWRAVSEGAQARRAGRLSSALLWQCQAAGRCCFHDLLARRARTALASSAVLSSLLSEGFGVEPMMDSEVA